MAEIEQKLVFAVAPSSEHEGNITVLIGIPRGAWEYMKDGKTNHVDLSSAGLPLQFIVYGAENHDAAKAVIDEHNARHDLTALDRRRDDFSIKPSSQSAPGGTDGSD